MTIGEYAGVPLQDNGDTWRHGAVFLLRKHARQTASELINGWRTTVVKGGNFVVTCGPSTATTFDRTVTEALNAANRGLDYISVTGQADCAIRDAPDDSLAWWPDPALNGVVMRCRIVQPLGLVLSATAVVTDAGGNVVPQPPPPTPVIDDAFRFVRMARTSDDLFDAYRNLFLAFESVLSDLRPRQKIAVAPTPPRPWWRRWIRSNRTGAISGNANAATAPTKWESESDWFSEALDEADKLVPLAALTPSNVTNHKNWINRWIYSAERSALMHAKRGQNYLLPHDATDRAELIESLGRLWYYVRDLIEKHLHVRAGSSSLSQYAFEQMARSVLAQFPLVVSDDDSGPINREAVNVLDAGATVVRLHSAAPRIISSDPNLCMVLAHCDVGELNSLATIRRFGQMLPDGSGKCEALSEFVGPLAVGGDVVRLEADRGFRHVNPTGPPRQFSS